MCLLITDPHHDFLPLISLGDRLVTRIWNCHNSMLRLRLVTELRFVLSISQHVLPSPVLRRRGRQKAVPDFVLLTGCTSGMSLSRLAPSWRHLGFGLQGMTAIQALKLESFRAPVVCRFTIQATVAGNCSCRGSTGSLALLGRLQLAELEAGTISRSESGLLILEDLIESFTEQIMIPFKGSTSFLTLMFLSWIRLPPGNPFSRRVHRVLRFGDLYPHFRIPDSHPQDSCLSPLAPAPVAPRLCNPGPFLAHMATLNFCHPIALRHTGRQVCLCPPYT